MSTERGSHRALTSKAAAARDRLSPRRCMWDQRRSRPAASRCSPSVGRGRRRGLEVPVSPVDLPFPARLRVAQPGDREPRPLRAKVGPPRRPALENRHGPIVDVELLSDLVTSTFGQPGIARIDPASDASKVGLGERYGEAFVTQRALGRVKWTRSTPRSTRTPCDRSSS